MKSGAQAAGFLLLFLFIFIFFSSSCASSVAKDRLEYAKNNFEAKVSGSIDGKEIGAVICSRPGTSESEIRATLRFTAPDSLNGIIVTLTANGECSVRLNGTVSDADLTAGLIDVFRPVFDAGDVYSVKKNDDGGEDVRVCDENCDLTYVFTSEGNTPSRIFGKYGGKSLDLSLRDLSAASKPDK